VTDSGGVQEECATLGIPCFIHRRATERSDGIGKNCVLTLMDVGTLEKSISEVDNFRSTLEVDSVSPSKIIVDYFQKMNS
jgi:UDP-N-acetylglucosamine 2-epimerase (non-hydrolysing)